MSGSGEGSKRIIGLLKFLLLFVVGSEYYLE